MKPCFRCKTNPRVNATYCRECQAQFNLAWRTAHPDKIKQSNAAWRAAHPGYSREHYQKNRARYVANARKNYLANIEHRKAMRAAYLKAHPEYELCYQMNRRARRQGKTDLTTVAVVRDFLRTHPVCEDCGAPPGDTMKARLTIGHGVPLAYLVGSCHPSNWVRQCQSCNSSQGCSKVHVRFMSDAVRPVARVYYPKNHKA